MAGSSVIEIWSWTKRGLSPNVGAAVVVTAVRAARVPVVVAPAAEAAGGAERPAVL